MQRQGDPTSSSSDYEILLRCDKNQVPADRTNLFPKVMFVVYG